MTATTKRKPLVLTTVGSFHGAIVDRLKKLGATVVVADSVVSASRLYRKASHVLLPGGSDIHPSNYNQSPTHSRSFSLLRDSIELMVADLALLDAKPMLGICRGHQVIAVAAGGTLYQDIWNNTGEFHGRVHHGIQLTADTRLAEIVKHATMSVNSYHHQAVNRMPEGWVIAASSSEDGIIEAIEHPDLPVISVQWHPEAMYSQTSGRIFRAFLDMKEDKR